MPEIELSPDDIEALRQLDERRPNLWTAQEFLQRRLTRWEWLVERLEGEGYRLGDHDFTNEVSSREGLEDLMEKVPSLRSKLTHVLEPLDVRFKEATRPLAEPIGGDFKNRKRVPLSDVHWWWFRYPKKHSRQLRPDERFNEVRFLDE